MPPAMELPIDVLGEIFVVCVTNEQRTRRETAIQCEGCKPLRIPSVLAQVCRQWRCAALSTPSMWRFIHLDLKTSCQVALRKEQFSKLFQRHVGLSGSCPLELSFANLGSDEGFNTVMNIIGTENNVAKRVKRLEIGLAGAAFLPFLSILQRAVTPNLEDLVLYHTGYFTPHESIPPEALIAFEKTPLKRLSLGRIQWCTMDVSLSGITSLSIDLGHEHEAILLRTLTSFPNLVELTLQCTDNFKVLDSWEPIPAATLPALERISFDPRICHYSLHKLDAPKLTYITARNFSRLSPRFLAYLPNQTAYTTLRIERFTPEDDWRFKQSGKSHWNYKSLEELRVEWTSSFTAGVPGFLACLKNHPEILTLELVECSIDSEYMHNLTTDASLLPKLTELRLSKCPNICPRVLDTIASERRSLSVFVTL
ncbi:hypothetical protein M408DRAFT_306943 [Serendipita vermifera MAFF 305830]|uniref:Uncharacterized protein n=1 Tax=Serendipita vermifera MAFF 305830 TaxID=933852 RepID=A0A0C2XJ85_SERVB|nr:hypothetical protein M408DRAFT_306943 [Serendipita vermifera MAFF 305830]